MDAHLPILRNRSHVHYSQNYNVHHSQFPSYYDPKRLLYINQYTCYRQHNSDDRKINHPRITKQRTEGSSAVPAGTQQAQAPDPSQQQQPEQPVPSQGHESAVIAEIIGKISQRGIYPAQQPVFLSRPTGLREKSQRTLPMLYPVFVQADKQRL